MKQFLYLLSLLCVIAVGITPSKAQNFLDAKKQPQFVNPLPIPAVIDARNGGTFTISVSQFEQNLGLIDPETRQPLSTKVWGYNGTYPGPTILAKKGVPINVTWQNQLVSNGKPLPHLLSIDYSIEWALAGAKRDWEKLGIPIVTHVHGGHTESASDGLPEAWFTPGFKLTGPGFVKKTLHYENDQQAATIWYHDHAMGITRLNVYAGLAGYYLLTDEHEKSLQNSYQIPSGAYDLGLAIQDRMFTTDGQLYYPSLSTAAGGPANSLLPEVFGDVILVNGKIWPYLEVEPRAYRFRVLNGSDSRFYNLHLSTGQTMFQIGSDGGLLPTPVTLSQALLGPGERKDIVIDFSAFSGQTIVLLNNAKTPYPKGSSVDPLTTGRIMAFKVTKALSSVPKAQLPATLRPNIDRLQTDLPARKLILFESTDEYGRLKVMLGTFEKGIMNYSDPVTEKLMQGSTEIWEIYNETVDAHPIHLHLVQMQLVNRQKFSGSVDLTTGQPSNVTLHGSPVTPGPDEIGWKDTYVMYPGQVTRVIANFDLPGLYAWHCHILSHEDHEMMRPYLVQETNKTTNVGGSKELVTEVASNVKQEVVFSTLPNPFNHKLTILLNLKHPSTVVVNIYDSKGALMQQVFNGKNVEGVRQFGIDGSNWSNGTYFCEAIINNQRMVQKLVLQK